MEERIKLNKVSLRVQKQRLALYERFLPALEARKQQLLLQLARVRQEILVQQQALDTLMREMAQWSSLFHDVGPLIRCFTAIEEVRFTVRNIAGLSVREFLGVRFTEPAYSLFATPYSFDDVLHQSRDVVTRREAIRLLREQERILFEGFRKTSQRINLYEQRLIPDCRGAIRKITVYLQDQQAAAVGVAKVAKRMAARSAYT